MKIGSHCSMSSPDYFLGSVKEALSYGANALMIYTGPPQNSNRKPIKDMKVEEAHALLQENNIPVSNVVVHAPYLINLANTFKPETFQLSVDLLKSELERTNQLGCDTLILHPGSHVGAGAETGIESIIKGINEAMGDNDTVYLTLETMSGKGSEVGRSFEEIQSIIEGVEKKHLIRVCLDTCHIHDAGYDINQIDDVLTQFDQTIGLDRLTVIHVNDSKNIQGASKDRHENLGKGEIGLENLLSVLYHPKLENCVKILETPYIEKKAPYKEEIAIIKANAR